MFQSFRRLLSEGPILTEPIALKDGGLDWNFLSYFSDFGLFDDLHMKDWSHLM